MAELINKQKAIDVVVEAHCYGTDIMEALQSLSTTTESEIRAKAIDEFAEKLKAELLLSKNVISERRKMCESGSHMEGIYSSSIGTLNGAYSMVDRVAEQLKEE